MITVIYSLNIHQRREFIKSHLKKRSIRFKLQPFTKEGYEGENIIVEKWFKEDIPNIVVSAHYDGWGAYDNAGGTAGLLWLLNWIQMDESNHKNGRFGLIVVFLDGEESGLLGVKFFIRNYLLKRNITVRGQLSLDGFGIGTHIGGFANTKQVKLRLDSKKEEIRFKLEADTVVFQEYRIRSLHLFSLPYQELKAFLDKREFPPSWKILHTKNDTPDKIEEEFLPFVVLNLYRNIHLLDFQSKGALMVGG